MLPRNFQGICGKKFYHQLYTNLSIAPNTFSTIVTNYINDETYSGSSLVAGTTYTLSNVCFWTSSPNFKSDANHANDAYCGNVILPVTTGLKEINAETITVIAYPNPTYDIVNINLPNYSFYEIKLFDDRGQILYQNYGNQKIVDLAGMSPGVYLIEIKTSDKIIKEKIVKNRRPN